MLIKNLINVMVFIISVFSILNLIYSIKNKNKYICKNIIVVSSFYIIYLILLFIIENLLSLPIGLEILYFMVMLVVAVLLYIIAIVLNVKKMKKTDINIKAKKYLFVTLLLILLPVLVVSAKILKDVHMLNSSNLIVIYESDGNGGLGDGTTFAYAIGDDFCKEFDLAIDIGGLYLVDFLKKEPVVIDDENEISDMTDYVISFDEFAEDDNFFVYKNDKVVCEIDVNSKYFNIDFEKAYYIAR